MLKSSDIKEFIEQYPDLVRVKEDPSTGLRVLKYHNRVFYKDLWHVSPMLLKMRGMVTDEHYNPVIYPFDKVFNYRENGTYLPLDETVTIVRKINGFMAAARYVEPYGLVVSTTGTLDSPFADLARKRLEPFTERMKRWSNMTFIFEIVDESDPHIVVEDAGAYLIGARNMDTQYLLEPKLLHYLANHSMYYSGIGDETPTPGQAKFRDVLKWAKTIRHEGWMIYGSKTLKLKSSFYLTTKLLGRMPPEKLGKYLESGQKIQWMDEDFQWALDRLQQEKDYFLALDMPRRVEYVRNVIEEGLNDVVYK